MRMYAEEVAEHSGAYDEIVLIGGAILQILSQTFSPSAPVL